MNARQRRYLVASLRFLSLVTAAAYLTTLAIAWLLGTDSTPHPLFTPTSAALIALACGGAIWLAHFVRLGNELKVRNLGGASSSPTIENEDECPRWPTILAWLVTDLEGEEARRVTSHVSSCEECRKRLALMSAVQEMSSDRGR